MATARTQQPLRLTTQHSANVRALYRQFLRLQRRWPPEPQRPGRNLKELLQSRLPREFRQHATLSSTEEANRALEHGRLQYRHWLDLAENRIGKQVL